MKKRTKSTRAAWKEIRAAFQAYADGAARYDHRLTWSGVCSAICDLSCRISHKQHREMMCAVVTHKPRGANINARYWPLNRAGARRRVQMIDKILETL